MSGFDSIKLKHGRFVFDERGRGYPFGTWEMGALGVERSAVNPLWVQDHPFEAFELSANSYVLPVDAGLPMNIGSMGDNDGFYVYQLRDHHEDCIYVGQSERLHSRLKAHMTNPYGEQVELVLAAECPTYESMCLLESSLIIGWRPRLNDALKQFGDESMRGEANLLADAQEWNPVWGVGTMFWSTGRVGEHMLRAVKSWPLDAKVERIAEIGAMYGGDVDTHLVYEYIAGMDVHEFALNFRHDRCWGPSFGFMFDIGAYMEFAREVEGFYKGWKRKAAAVLEEGIA